MSINVLIEYTDSERNILIGDNEDIHIDLLKIIKNRDIPEWFKEDNTRINWGGLIQEIYRYKNVKKDSIIFELWADDEYVKIFTNCIDMCGYKDDIKILSSSEIAEKNLNLAKEYETQKNIGNAFRYYHASAKYGNSAKAQLWLGKYYLNGIYIEPDYEKSFEWLKKSAKQDNNVAERLLGDFYYCGYGSTNKDYSKALELYKKSADKDNDKAQYMIGMCYHYGHGVKKDLAKAFEWFLKSTEHGNDKAKLMVGKCYYYGYGTNVNNDLAFEYLKDFETEKALEIISKLGKQYYDDKHYSKAFQCLYKARSIDSEVQYLLGECFYNGYGTTQDLKKAF